MTIEDLLSEEISKFVLEEVKKNLNRTTFRFFQPPANTARFTPTTKFEKWYAKPESDEPELTLKPGYVTVSAQSIVDFTLPASRLTIEGEFTRKGNS